MQPLCRTFQALSVYSSDPPLHPSPTLHPNPSFQPPLPPIPLCPQDTWLPKSDLPQLPPAWACQGTGWNRGRGRKGHIWILGLEPPPPKPAITLFKTDMNLSQG